jgi:hypothetical protein
MAAELRLGAEVQTPASKRADQARLFEVDMLMTALLKSCVKIAAQRKRERK